VAKPFTMKTKNAEEIKAIAADIFSRYPKANKVAVTDDGTAFITDESDIAVKNHAKKNPSGKELGITNFLREDAKEENGETAATLIDKIKAAKTAEEVEAIKTAEASAKNRTSVIKAAEARIKELTKTE